MFPGATYSEYVSWDDLFGICLRVLTYSEYVSWAALFGLNRICLGAQQDMFGGYTGYLLFGVEDGTTVK